MLGNSSVIGSTSACSVRSETEAHKRAKCWFHVRGVSPSRALPPFSNTGVQNPTPMPTNLEFIRVCWGFQNVILSSEI